MLRENGGGGGEALFKDHFANEYNIGLLDGPQQFYFGPSGTPAILMWGTSGGGFQHVGAVAVGSLTACNSTYIGTRRLVNDATVATPGSPAVGSGTFTIAVQCIFNSTGSAYSWIID